MSGVLQDVRYGLRVLRRQPTFTAVAVLTLGLGIGINAAMFSVVNAVLLRPLPFHDPGKLVAVHEGVPTLGFSKIAFAIPDLMLYEQGQKSFQGMAAYRNDDFELSGVGEPTRITAARVTANLFPLLGVQPVLGRSFHGDEDRPGIAVVILGYGLWQSKYGGSRGVIGTTIRLDRIPYTVIGVMPRDFQFPLAGASSNNEPAQLWVPRAFTPADLSGWARFNDDVVARLKAGVTLAQARGEAEAMAQRIVQAYPADLLQRFTNTKLVAVVDPLQAEVSGSVRPLLLLLQGAVGLVLLIACTNVALLLLSRASGRAREMAVRTALGAGRVRLLTQLLTESFLLASLGGALGLGLAIWFKTFLLNQVPAAITLPRVHVDAGVLIFTFSITFLAAIFFGLAPALHATRTSVREGMQEGGRSGTGSRTRHRVQSAFVIAEFGLALLLLVGAGLLLRTFEKLLAANPGFQPERVLAMTVPLPQQAYPNANDVRNYYQRALLELSRLPGVVSVGAANDLPLAGNELDAVEVEGHNKSTTPAVRQSWVLGDYLRTMGIPLIRGRLFTPEDREGTQPVTVVSENMAKILWPNEDAIGKRILRGGADGQWLTVIGVVGDVPDSAMSSAPRPHCYSPYLQERDAAIATPDTLRSLQLAVRSQGNPDAVAAGAVDRLHHLDPALAISNVRTMQTDVNQSIAPQRFNAMLVGIYGGLALILALIGIYGVLAYMVMQQTHEIGIRMALGAQRRHIIGLVVMGGMRLVLAGAAIGLVGAWGVTRLMQSLLYGVAPGDPLTFVVVTGLLSGAALLACYVPAMRAARIDPMSALHYE